MTAAPIRPRPLVVLHGYEDEPGRRFDHAALDPTRWSIVEPRGPVELAGGPAWYASDDAGPVEADLVRSLGQLDGLLAVTGAPAVVGGFSQGGAVALALALAADPERSGSDPPVRSAIAGAFCINGWLPHAEAVAYDPSGLAAAAPPILIVASTEDEVVPVQQGRSAARYLERAGVTVTYLEVPGGHAVGADAIDAWREWLDSIPPPESGA